MQKALLIAYTPEALTEIVKGFGHSAYRAKQLWQYLVRGASFEEMNTLPKDLRQALAQDYDTTGVRVVKAHESADGTAKLLFGLNDGQAVEGVLMGYHHGTTLCLSTQAGCRMGCAFCASTLEGLARNLSVGEMLGQVVAASRFLRQKTGKSDVRQITNLVLMGSGEPLDNYEHTVCFLRAVTNPQTFGFSARNISLSTCGLPENMRALAKEGLPLTLCLSLHAPTDEVRKRLMPGAAVRGDIAKTMSAAREYVKMTGRRLVIEYILIDKVNDTPDMAKQLAGLLRGLQCHVNLIPYNAVPGKDFKAPSTKGVEVFLQTLTQLGVSATRRRTLGDEVSGACGQLRRQTLQEQKGETQA